MSLRKRLPGDLDDGNGLLILDPGGGGPVTILPPNPPKPPPTIPDRVESRVPLLVQKSLIKPQGDGVFVQKEVKAGDMIYRVKTPILNIVNDGEQALANTCEFCFTVKHLGLSSKHSPLSSTDEDFIVDRQTTFSRCASCHIYSYCDKRCQKAAWKQHHKVECAILNDISKRGKGAVLLKKNIRSIVRLLSIRKNNVISKEDWEDIKRLPSGKQAKMRDPTFRDDAGTCADIITGLEIMDLGHEEVIDLFCIMHQNQRSIMIPLIKGPYSYLSAVPAVFDAGVTLEPSTSKISHSCNPNSWLVFEGKELRLRALRDIGSSQELTVSLVECPEFDHNKRRTILRLFYNIDCSCDLCAKGPIQISPSLRKKLTTLGKYNSSLVGSCRLSQVQEVMEGLQHEGIGWSFPPMPQLHHLLILFHYGIKDATECLKLCLKIRYLVEPAQFPPTPLAHKINTLYNLISYLKFTESGQAVCDLETLPENVKWPCRTVQFHLRRILARDTAICYGADSGIAQFERKLEHSCRNYFIARLPTPTSKRRESKRDGMTIHLADFSTYINTPLEESAFGRAKFVANMNYLLTWAGLPELTEKELI